MYFLNLYVIFYIFVLKDLLSWNKIPFYDIILYFYT